MDTKKADGAVKKVLKAAANLTATEKQLQSVGKKLQTDLKAAQKDDSKGGAKLKDTLDKFKALQEKFLKQTKLFESEYKGYFGEHKSLLKDLK